MQKKIGLICLSAMLITLAVGYSSNTTESIRANATAKKSNSEQKGRKRDYENDFADNIIDISESAVVSKNIVDSSEKISNDEASITLNKVIRGAEAEKIINEYNKNASTSKIPQLANNSLEYVIVEYTTSLSNNTKTTKDGQYSTVGIEVCNLDGSSLINENNDYIIRKFTHENSVGLQSNDSGSTKIVLTLPKALTEFVVKLGDNRNNMASFRVS